ncbi:hypothetical protein CKO29_09790 [Allochromatium vinosum]|nr:hypothetical protein [Allochromatium vinosum]
MAAWFQDKWTNRVRQFGLRAALAQAARAALRPVWEAKRDLVMAIPDHRPEPVDHAEIRRITREDVEAAADRGELTERQRTLLTGFFDEGCYGFLAEVGGRLAGYAFVQPAGAYTWAGSGRFQIPEGMRMLKNLLVFPGFRGHSLGKKLNQARIASIPADQTPIVFVMTENRFAIRNLKLFGFEEMLVVTRTTWLKRWTRQTVGVLRDGDFTRRLAAGLEGR